MHVEFYGLQFDLPSGWVDITEDLPLGAPPTLGRMDGIGTIQFSAATYKSGQHQSISVEDLKNFLKDFCRENLLEFSKPRVRLGDIMSVQITSFTDNEVVSACYISNGKDIALITYTCLNSHDPALKMELEDMQVIVETAII